MVGISNFLEVHTLEAFIPQVKQGRPKPLSRQGRSRLYFERNGKPRTSEAFIPQEKQDTD